MNPRGDPVQGAAEGPRPTVPDYELLRRVGGGAYGEVWLARNKATGVFRAVKIVWRRTFQNDRPYQREFEGIQKFEAVSRMHPSQLALFHIGRNEAEGYFYYVMELADDLSAECGVQNAEYPDGAARILPTATAVPDSVSQDAQRSSPTPHSALRTPHSYVPHTLRADLANGRLPPTRVLEIGLALAEALGHLHKHGLVHRDVKPSNVIFVQGRPKLADIGLVTDTSDKCSIVGTEGYLPPEGPGTPQADIFALGKLLYEAATGLDRRQFPQLPRDLHDWPNAKLVFELNEILLKACVAAAPERYRSAEDMRSDLALLQTGQSVKRLRVLERRWAAVIRAAVLVTILGVVALGVLYAINHRRQAVTRYLVREHVTKGTDLMNRGDLFDCLLEYSEALWLDRGDPKREENHRIRIASVLRDCPKLVGLFAHSGATVNRAEISPDSQWVVTSSQDDRTARLWDLATGTERFCLTNPGPVYCAAFSPNGAIVATTCADNLVRFWSTQTGQALPRSAIRHTAKYSGPHPSFSPDSARLLTCEDEYTLRLWSAATGEPLGQPLRHEHAVDFFAFSRHGERIVTMASDHHAHLWDGFTGRPVGSLRSGGAVTSFAFCPDAHTLAVAGDDRLVRLLDLEPRGPSPALPKQRTPVDSLAFSPEGDRLALVCQDRTVGLLDVVTGAELLRPLEHELDLIRASFSPDGRWVITEGHGDWVQFWNADTGERMPPPLTHSTPFGAAPFSPDGHLLLTQRDDLIVGDPAVALVWSLARSEPLRLRIRPIVSFERKAYSSDGRQAVLSGTTVRIVAHDSGKTKTQFTTTLPPRQVLFTADDGRIVTEEVDGRGQVRDSETGEPLTSRLPVEFARDAPARPALALPPAEWPAEDLVLLAQLLSGKRVDEAGGFTPLELSALTSAWETLKRKYPESFKSSEQDVLAWHDQEAKACEQAWNWWAAQFHLDYLAAARPGDQGVQARLTYARQALECANRCASGYRERRRVIPPRNPLASDRMIDLSPYYNSSGRDGAAVLAALPGGIQPFAGTAFDVRGLVRLAGTRSKIGAGHPEDEVRNIGVNQKCHRLLFLHGTENGSIDSTEVATYVVHYEDGRTEPFTIRYGQDVRCWRTTKGEALGTEKPALAWIGADPNGRLNDSLVRIFKSAWENPWPDTKVTSVDFAGAGTGVRPFLVAITAE